MLKILKVIFIIIFGAFCVLTASGIAERYAAEAAEKEQTLAEAVMKSQLEAELKKAEEKAQKELEEQGTELVTEVLETKPPVTTTAETITTSETTAAEPETTVTETETTTAEITETSETSASETEETTSAEDEIITEFTRGGLLPKDRTGVPVRSLFLLSDSEMETLTNYLIEHYFLDGYKYSSEETRPELKEKKRFAADMESSVVETVNMVFANINVNDVSAILSADYGKMKDDVTEIRSEFEKEYADAASYGEEFGDLYENSLKYFDRLIEAIENIENVSDKYSKAENPLLALGLLAGSLENVIIPEIMGVLERSFDLVEDSQEIFLEGTQGTQLLTRDEVRDIITNPGLIL